MSKNGRTAMLIERAFTDTFLLSLSIWKILLERLKEGRKPLIKMFSKP